MQPVPGLHLSHGTRTWSHALLCLHAYTSLCLPTPPRALEPHHLTTSLCPPFQCYHDGLCLNNSWGNWAKILASFAILWTGVSLFFFALIQVSLTYGTEALWGYLVCFGIAVFVIAVAVILGSRAEKKTMEADRKRREQQEREAQAKLGLTTTVVS